MQYKLLSDDYIHGGVQKDIYSESDVTTCNCPLCGATEKTEIYRERGSLGIAECVVCGLIYTNPRALESEKNYFGEKKILYDEGRLIFNGKHRHHRDENYEYELKKIMQYKSSGKLLDIGTSMGFFLRKARQAGFNVCGVEPSPASSEIAIEQFNLNIVNDYFHSSLFPSRHFDVVTLIDVFEHVTQPQNILKEIHLILKDDGLLCIKVPNGNYNKFKLKLARLLGKEQQHDIFNSYEHVVHYTAETIKAMLDKNGFKIKKFLLPIPVHPPVWANLVGHYYEHSSPFILDWKRVTLRNLFYYTGKIEKALGVKIEFAPDLMFMVEKK